MHFIIAWGWSAYLDSEAFGTDKGEEDNAYNGFGDPDDDESEDVEDDHPEGAGASEVLQAQPEQCVSGGSGGQQ